MKPLFNPVMTGIATRFMAELPTAASRIAPVFNTSVASSQYFVHDQSSFTDVPTNIDRAPSSAFKRYISKLSDDSFIARDRGVEEPIDKAEARMYASIYSAQQAAVERTVRIVAINHEIRVNKLVRSVTATSSPTVKWNASTGTTIIADIEAAKQVIRGKIGVTPNLLTLSYDTWLALRLAPELKAYYSSVQGGLLTMDNLKALFGVDDIQVAGTLINTANEGQTPVIGDIWTDEAFLSYSVPSTDIKSLNFARTFNWTGIEGSGPNGISIFTYVENPIDSDIVRARQYSDEKITAPGAGYYFSNTLA